MRFRLGQPACAQAVDLLLRRMSQGGIYDHLGGGYARYSVDAIWLVPHFEKMLYDNAQILELLASPTPRGPTRFRAAGRRDGRLASARDAGREDGAAFASSLDADSEGEEGKFYVWTAAEVDALLGQDSPLFSETYDVDAAGNWEGHVILNRRRRPEMLGEPRKRPSPAAAPRCSSPGQARPARAATTRCSPTGTGSRSRPWSAPPPSSTARIGSTPPGAPSTRSPPAWRPRTGG
jgi:uncharacterized protein YyaL (SSP411 family)